MRRRGGKPGGRRIIAAAAPGLLAALAASCSAASPLPAPGRAAGGTAAFTVSGTHPVPVNGSQDTSAAAAGAACDASRLSADRALGAEIAGGFSVAGFPAAATLLTHFLQGRGTEVDYPAGSAVAAQARASSGFRIVNADVQAEIAAQLRAGVTRVRLSAAQLPTVVFGSQSSDLYWGFRGTQGLTVTGSGHRGTGRYAGVLTYVIRDSYGFPADDTLGGFGAPMRYLQTACGAPRHAGGAHWFPDTITVTVPFSRPA
jgi:hypothetical protein